MLYKRKDIKDWKALVKEGNIIKIRQWDDMEEEYGLVGIGSINCECTFTNNMRSLCGSEIKINEDSAIDWLNKGAIPTDTVKNLFSKAGIMEKYHNLKQGK